jgi:hypothetical protein
MTEEGILGSPKPEESKLSTEGTFSIALAQIVQLSERLPAAGCGSQVASVEISNGALVNETEAAGRGRLLWF